jgi:hypothetical protein
MEKCNFYIRTPEVALCSKKLRPLNNKYLTSFTVLMNHTSQKERKGMVRMCKGKNGS